MPFGGNKYGARKTERFGIMFDSRKEAERYMDLRAMLDAGDISDLKLQPRFLIIDRFTDRTGKRHRETHYSADFQYTLPNGQVVVEETKGNSRKAASRDFGLRWKLVVQRYPDIEFRLVE